MCSFSRNLCAFDDVAELADPQPDVVSRHQDKTVATVDRLWSRLHQSCLTVSTTYSNGIRGQRHHNPL